MRRIRAIVACMVGISLWSASTVFAEAVSVTDPPVVYDSDIVISGFQTSTMTELDPGTKLDVVELYNNGNSPHAMDGWSVEGYGVDDSLPSCTLSLSPNASTYVLPDSYALTAEAGLVDEGNSEVRLYSSVCGASGVAITKLILRSPDGIEDVIEGIPSTGAYVRRGVTASYRDQDPFASNNIALSATSGTGARTSHSFYSGGWYVPPTQSPVQIVELFPNAPPCAPDDTTSLCTDYVKLYNPTSRPIDLSQFRVRTGSRGSSATSSNTSVLSGVLQPGHYLSVALALTSGGNWVWIEDGYGVRVYDNTIASYPSASGHDMQAWSYNASIATWQWTNFPTPQDEPNRFTDGSPINDCHAVKLSEIGANYSPQFIEVFNVSTKPISITGCQLQTNRSTTESYVFGGGEELAPGEYRSVMIASSPLTLTKTTSGTVYVLDSTGSTEVDSQSYDGLSEDTSWALVNGRWRQTYAVTPGRVNEFEEYPSCEAGYYRNTQTGRCNKIAVASPLTPCRSDQYRSQDTNRCRLLTSTASTLKPCAPNQSRNPATNRCRLISSSASSTLKPCLSNQERNPDTNRCRKIRTATIPSAGYPLKDTAAGDSAIGWLAFAGVGGLAVGYGIWEWRREIAGLIGSLASTLKR